MRWQPIATVPPYVCVLLARAGDLYPVAGWRWEDPADGFVLEEGGAEDGEHRRCPPLGWQPDLWAPLPDVPSDTARYFRFCELIDEAARARARRISPPGEPCP